MTSELASAEMVPPVRHLARFRSHAGRLLRFGIVGVAATAVHVGAIAALVEFADLNPRIANLIAFCMAVCVNYFGHYYWSFASSEPHGETVIRFVVVSVSCLVASQGLMHLVLDGFALPYGYGLALIVTVMPVVSFLAQQAFVFRRRRGRPDPD